MAGKRRALNEGQSVQTYHPSGWDPGWIVVSEDKEGIVTVKRGLETIILPRDRVRPEPRGGEFVLTPTGKIEISHVAEGVVYLKEQMRTPIPIADLAPSPDGREDLWIIPCLQATPKLD